MQCPFWPDWPYNIHRPRTQTKAWNLMYMLLLKVQLNTTRSQQTCWTIRKSVIIILLIIYQFAHTIYPIACLWGWVMECLLCVVSVTRNITWRSPYFQRSQNQPVQTISRHCADCKVTYSIYEYSLKFVNFESPLSVMSFKIANVVSWEFTKV